MTLTHYILFIQLKILNVPVSLFMTVLDIINRYLKIYFLLSMETLFLMLHRFSLKSMILNSTYNWSLVLKIKMKYLNYTNHLSRFKNDLTEPTNKTIMAQTVMTNLNVPIHIWFCLCVSSIFLGDTLH